MNVAEEKTTTGPLGDHILALLETLEIEDIRPNDANTVSINGTVTGHKFIAMVYPGKPSGPHQFWIDRGIVGDRLLLQTFARLFTIDMAKLLAPTL